MPQDDSSQRTTKIKPPITGYPSLEFHSEEVFVIVKAYPHPSEKYLETVCTVGITRQGKLIRLHPIPFRYLDDDKKYPTYQWIRVDMEKHEGDKRIDSYRPNSESIELLGEKIGTEDGWRARKKIVLPCVINESLEDFNSNYKKYRSSLGIFLPERIIDFKTEASEKQWSPKHEILLNQRRLFGPQPRPLEKVPYKFSCVFSCRGSKCKECHKLSIVDWGIFQLYRNLKEKHRFDEDTILRKMKEKWLEEICGNDRDSYLIVGTHSRWGTPLILGAFWPPKDRRISML